MRLLTVVTGKSRPPGWSGKLWAVAQGIAEADGADFVLLTDADIVHDPRHVATLVAHAERGDLDLVSEMVALACDTRGRARAGAGIRVLLPAALSVRLGERPAARHGGGGRRHHAAPPPCAASDRRCERGARRADRRCRTGGGGQAGRADLAWPFEPGAIGTRLSDGSRHLAHGVAHRLCAASLLAAAADRHCPWR